MPRHLNPLPQLVIDRLNPIRKRVKATLWDHTTSLDVQGSPIVDQALDARQAARLKYRPVRAGEHFGKQLDDWRHRWFKLRIPAAKPHERGRRHLRWASQGETTAYVDGVPWAGLDVGHPTCPLPDSAATIYLDTGLWVTGIWVHGAEPVSSYGLRFDAASLNIRNTTAWDLHWDIDALTQLARLLLRDEGINPPGIGYHPPVEEVTPLLRILLRGIDECCDAWNTGGIPAMRKATAALIKSLPAEHWQPTAALAGHAHIDVVWLWPESATRHKNVHSFATQLRLLERYPEMVFVHSTPAVYRAVEQDAPGLIPQIKKAVKRGQWEIMGGFEVEPDVNMPAGEALARSIVYGNRYIEKFAGKPSTVCWIPDVFGYSNCLPQILALGGVTRFYTQKMTWSSVTRFPYTSFVWKGSDGQSEVVAHLATTGYNGEVKLEDNRKAVALHQQADIHPATMIGTGYGDGGGGVCEFHNERARRLADLAGSPKHKWTTSAAFFEDLEQVKDKLPVYQGELYLEYHRGVLTSQAKFKRLYRAAETALQAHEAVRVADAGKPLGEDAWLRVLFGQFHDALPGSSITKVYDQLHAEYEQIIEREQEHATRELGGGGRKADGAVVFNPLPQPRTVLISAAGRGRTLVHLPGVGTARLSESCDAPQVTASTKQLDNSIVRAKFNARGQLTGLRVDGVDLDIAEPAGLRLYHDEPQAFDAWDIDHYTAKTARPVAEKLDLKLKERNKLRAVLEGTAEIGDKSKVKLRYILEAGARHLRVEADIDWREDHKLLKYHVPTGYMGRVATFGAPFGSTQRPQLPGTPRDEAMWESCGNRWAAVHDDGGHGLAILAEAKYGYSCFAGDLGLSLLKSAKHPDPAADMGRHTIRFAIGQHQTHTRDGVPSTACAADALFAPVVVAEQGADRTPPFELADLGSLCPSWVSPSETGAGYVLRLHEAAGTPGSFTLKLNRNAKAVTCVNFNEQKLDGVAQPKRRGKSDTWTIDYGPYQVVSVLVRG